ncbi:hypothetical protein SAMN05661096_02762 [Marivirga sericea]|uniref:DUF4374 domain-containing protein n=1 Tax=Marivirga sericea TaxID=1028 RepID=A0A1X7KGS9_9BACT|nr:hypothetical protein [Marivirga sericea]SMG40538.1 hypothetical protein SAMN05661096_02762 [Marivirga sericea]
MKNSLIVLGLITSFFIFSCESDELSLEQQSFLKIYDDANYNASYSPVGLHQSGDNFFVLSERRLTSSDFSGINLVVTDSIGDFVNEQQLEDNFVAPTKSLLKVGTSLYFFCMDRNSLRPYLAVISEDSTLNTIALNTTASYPLAANVTANNNLLLLSYDPDGLNTILTEVSREGRILQQARYSIGPGSDVQDAIVNHFTKRSARLPFFCGQTAGNRYYFNGFYNYTLSMVFTNFGDDPTGVLQGQGSDAGLKAAYSTAASDFTIVGYQFSDHFMNAKTTLPLNNISSSVNLFDRNIPEIAEKAVCRIIPFNGINRELVIIASETEGRQVVLYFYDINSGQLEATYYLGTLNPFTLSSIIELEDGGIAIAGTTFLAGRFERIYLQKITRAQLLEIL